MPTRTSTATISRPRFRPRWAALMISLRPGAEHRGRRIDETAEVQVALAEAAGIMRSEEHTSELQSLMRISYAVFCLKKKKHKRQRDEDNKTDDTANTQ